MRRFLSYYYLATPAFAGLDLLLGVNVRTAVFGDSPARWLYYLASFGCGVVAYRKPALAPLLGMAESGVNILLLILGVYLPIWNAMDALENGAAVSPVLTPEGMVNVAISGVVLAIGFYGNRARA